MTTGAVCQIVATVRVWIAVVVVTVISLSQGPSPGFAQARTNSSADSKDELVRAESSKLRAEERKLRAEEKRLGRSWWEDPAILTVAAAALAAFLAFAAQTRETHRLRTADLDQRVYSDFNTLSGALVGPERAPRIGAITAIERFTKKDRAEYHEQVVHLLLGALKAPGDPISDALIREVLKRMLRTRFPALLVDGEPPAPTRTALFDFSFARLTGLDLSSLDLRGARFVEAYLEGANLSGAQLQGADFTGAHLERVFAVGTTTRMAGARFNGAALDEAVLSGVRLTGASFEGADLTSAKLRRADLRNVRFHRAKMQGAQLTGSVLNGARFRNADVADANFKGAKLDDETERSLRGAGRWEEARR